MCAVFFNSSSQDANKRVLTIQLLGKEDFNDDSNAEDRYESYVASYMDWIKETEGVDHKKLRRSFLQRYGYCRDQRQGACRQYH
jgi:histone deacetylase complex regulatory component SIN3